MTNVIDFTAHKRARTYAWRWLNAVKGEGLPHGCYMLGQAFAWDVADDQVRNVIWLNQAQLSAVSGLSIPEVRNAANQLAAAGALEIIRLGELHHVQLRDWLLWHGKDSRAYVYLLISPDEWAGRAATSGADIGQGGAA